MNDVAPPAPEAFSSAHTASFPPLLRELGASLLVTTFQAGRVIVMRPQGNLINTHFFALPRPMGLAADRERIFVGAHRSVHEYRNVPAVAPRVEGGEPHDAVYLLRNVHVTGHVDIHEMAFAGSECWYVNTLFSCLCTLDNEHSFVPRWRPRFVSGYAPEDRCHLNGLAMGDGKPRFLSALGESNEREGWRASKRTGGIVIEIDSGEIVARGLSMPHSPRLYRGRLWVLESGRGALSTVDPVSGRVEIVAQVPGFTRGLDFVGSIAFIGLSQLRASNPFTDIPLTDENPERSSGVWAVNVDTGRTVAFLRFSATVEEIFAVQALQGLRSPMILEEHDPLLDSTWAIPDALLREVERPAAPGAATGTKPA
ncbi:MAG: TIGR03032 family protein [Betaproteobacteria bacterium]